MKTRLIATVIFTFALFMSVAALTLFAPGALAPTTAAEIPEAGGALSSPAQVQWIKEIDGVNWKPEIFVTVETSNTVMIEDTVITDKDFEILEEWDSDHLKLLDWEVEPNVGQVEAGAGFLRWKVKAREAPNGATLRKWFHIEPCNWTGHRPN